MAAASLSDWLVRLPRPRTSLIGRERERAVVGELLRGDDVPLVNLIGPGGVGKTRLAIQVGWDVADAFAGVWFVSLAPVRDPDLVLPTIAQSLGVRETSGQPLIERLAAFLPGDSALLILDNFEQVAVAAPLVADLLACCPSLKLLVTSRVVLHLTGEHAFPVPPLKFPTSGRSLPLHELAEIPAVALFVQRARAANADFALTTENASAVAEVCARLDGLPLAIELAAARSRLLSPAALLGRLTNRLTLLTGGPRDQPVRLQTLRNAIAWSYDLLDPAEQTLFHRLAVFLGGFTLDAVEGLRTEDSGLSRERAPESVLDLLASLVDKSLLRLSPQSSVLSPRYAMLETIREYAHEQLVASGEEAATRAAHAAYYLALAEEAEPKLIVAGSAAWVDRLAMELANLRAAVAWTLENGEATPVLRLAGTILSLAYARGAPGEGQQWLEPALAMGGDTAPEIRVDALFTTSALAQVQGDFARSTALSEEGLAIARGHGYAFGQARVLFGLGITAEWQGDLDRAAALYRESDALMRSLPEPARLPHWIPLPLANLADIALLRGDFAQAIILGEEAVRNWREVGYLWGIAQALGTVAAAVSEQGDQARASALYDETLTHWLACDDGRGIAGTIAGIAGVAKARGQLERAGRLLGAAWALGDALGVRYLGHHVHAERVRAATRLRLGEAAFAAAWTAGQALSMEETVAEARAALVVPDDDRRPTGPRPAHGLSPRELDVLRLIVAGHPDREIADVLSISPRTVQSHVASLFAKFGVNTRAEAAAVAVRKGVV